MLWGGQSCPQPPFSWLFRARIESPRSVRGRFEQIDDGDERILSLSEFVTYYRLLLGRGAYAGSSRLLPETSFTASIGVWPQLGSELSHKRCQNGDYDRPQQDAQCAKRAGASQHRQRNEQWRLAKPCAHYSRNQ